MNNKKIILAGLVGVAAIGAAAALFLTQKNDTTADVNISTSNNNTDDTTVQQDTAVDQEKLVLSINPHRCTGCGKCAMIDPQHFQMQSNQAVVISQEDLDSSRISQAQSMCKFSAITLL